MDDILLNLVVLVILALLGGGIFLFVRHRQSGKQQELLRQAAEKGWTVESVREPLTWGLRLSSDTWKLEALSHSSGQEAGPGSSNISMSTLCQAESAGGTFMIGPRTTQANLGEMGSMLARRVIQAALGESAQGISEYPVGSTSFQSKYMVWGTNGGEIEQILTPQLESTLLAWQGQKPLIKRHSGTLSIELKGVRLQKWDDLSRLVALGETLLN
jgi:hypothetical protein